MQKKIGKKNNIQFNNKNHASSGLRYSKPLKTYEKKITQKIEQSVICENTLSTNSCKHQYKHPFSEPFKIILQKIA